MGFFCYGFFALNVRPKLLGHLLELRDQFQQLHFVITYFYSTFVDLMNPKFPEHKANPLKTCVALLEGWMLVFCINCH
jgi:hypothetical protein